MQNRAFAGLNKSRFLGKEDGCLGKEDGCGASGCKAIKYYNQGINFFRCDDLTSLVLAGNDFSNAINFGEFSEEYWHQKVLTCAYYARGVVYYHLKQYEKAAADFNHRYCRNQFQPNVITTLYRLHGDDIYVIRGATYYSIGEYAKALKDVVFIIKDHEHAFEILKSSLEAIQNHPTQLDLITDQDREAIVMAIERHPDSQQKNELQELYNSFYVALARRNAERLACAKIKLRVLDKFINQDTYFFYWRFVASEGSAFDEIKNELFNHKKNPEIKYKEIKALAEKANGTISLFRHASVSQLYEHIVNDTLGTDIAEKYFAKCFFEGYVSGRKERTLQSVNWIYLLNAIIMLHPVVLYYKERARYLMERCDWKNNVAEADMLIADLKKIDDTSSLFTVYQQTGRFQEALDYGLTLNRAENNNAFFIAKFHAKLDHHTEALFHYYFFYIVLGRPMKNENDLLSFLQNVINKKGFTQDKEATDSALLKDDNHIVMLKQIIGLLSIEKKQLILNEIQKVMPELTTLLNAISELKFKPKVAEPKQLQAGWLGIFAATILDPSPQSVDQKREWEESRNNL